MGDGTPQAFIPILTGSTEEELPLTRYEHRYPLLEITLVNVNKMKNDLGSDSRLPNLWTKSTPSHGGTFLIMDILLVMERMQLILVRCQTWVVRSILSLPLHSLFLLSLHSS